MPVSDTSSVLPREELALAVVEGEGAVRGLVGDKILGPLPITWRNAHLVKATLAGSIGLRQISAAKYVHAPGTRFERLTGKFGDATLTVTPRGVEIVVPREIKLDYATRLDVEAFFCARFGEEIGALTKEVLISNQIFSTSNFGSATNSAVAYTVANLATISFVGDVIASTRRLKAKGEPGPYVLVASGPVYERIRQAATVQAYTVGSLKAGQEADKGMILSGLKEYGIVDFLVGDGYYNNAADSATPSLSQIWNNTYMFVGRPGMTGVRSETGGVGVPTISGIGANVYWEGYDSGGTPSADRDAFTMAGGNYVETYPSLEIDSTVIRLKMSHQPTITNARAGDLIATQYS